MRKLFSFMVTTLDGFTEGPNGEFDWPNVDDEFTEWAIRQLYDIDTLLFGRVTYEVMASYWTTPEAHAYSPTITALMNEIDKVVFSSTLDAADWQNTILVKTDAAEAVEQLKGRPGRDLAIFGSATLTVSLLEAGLVDELRVMINPILLGGGVTLFSTLKDRVRLEPQRTVTFRSGNVALHYRPIAN
jgi:dihydrofolate reductase